ncbi:hypothetical protein AB0B79_30215 [Streptomyces sp. NPDC039022]|uniref:nSTAND1 domain-containing NTPase n=1 Tax=unclassified Streptomyces TaxID=2593676 RepID=UPI00340CD563
MLAGPSGSGKPSLLRAGLIPNLRTNPTAHCSIRRRLTAKPGRCPAHGTSVQGAPISALPQSDHDSAQGLGPWSRRAEWVGK